MKIEQIEERLLEVNEIEAPFIKLLETTRNELHEVKLDARSIKHLEDIKTFSQSVIDGVKKIDEQDKLNFAINSFKQLNEHTKSKIQEIQTRVITTTERISVLESTIEYLRNRSISYVGKKEAITRVLEGTGDPKHPEKISTLREVERIKKSKKGDI